MNSTSIFDWLHMMAGNIWLYGGAFFLVLGILVFVHEWGHFIVARMCGVRIESFSIGFGPELFGYTARSGTRWKFSLIPLGGYVKMFGDTDPASAGHTDEVTEGEVVRPFTDSERKSAFFAQPVGRRALIVFAGPAINFIFAIIVLTGLFTFYGEPVTPAVAGAVIAGSPAEAAGFLPHDEVLAIDGSTIHRFEDIKREVMVGLDTPRDFTVLRNGKTIDIKATPRRHEDKDRFGFRHETALLGLISSGNAIDISSIKMINGHSVANVAAARQILLTNLDKPVRIQVGLDKDGDVIIVTPPATANQALRDPKNRDYNHLVIAPFDNATFVRHSLPDSFRDALHETYDVTTSTFKALGQIITGMRSTKELGGIIRIGALAGDMAKTGAAALISFMALLSINLGLVNLFPIPMLDGGHLVFYAVEAIKGKPIPEQIQEYAFRIGLFFLVIIMVFANLNDIVQLIL